MVIAVDEDEELEEFSAYAPAELAHLSADQVRENLLRSGLWTAFRTRPYSKIPAVDAVPRAIFVNAVDSNPLAADPVVVMQGREESFAQGLRALTRLGGQVYLCKAAGSAIPAPNLPSLTVAEFAGPHPAGLVGTHIHFLHPVDKARTAWHLNYQDVIAIGRLFTRGRLEPERVIALGGPQVTRPRLLRTRLGAALDALLAAELRAGENRAISGSVLCGRHAVGAEAYLGRYHLQVSVLVEEREQAFMGWAAPGRDKFSVFNLYSSRLHPGRRLAFTTTTGGETRPMVPIGTYEAVMPLDLLATHLLRALIVGDTDAAQELGCLELDEEDLALCTFVCPGKYDYGLLLRAALEHIEKAG